MCGNEIGRELVCEHIRSTFIQTIELFVLVLAINTLICTTAVTFLVSDRAYVGKVYCQEIASTKTQQEGQNNWFLLFKIFTY